MDAYKKEKLNVLIKAIKEYFAYDKKQHDKVADFDRIYYEVKNREPETIGFHARQNQYDRICRLVNKAKKEKKRLIKLDKWKLRWHIKRAFKELVNAYKDDENTAP